MLRVIIASAMVVLLLCGAQAATLRSSHASKWILDDARTRSGVSSETTNVKIFFPLRMDRVDSDLGSHDVSSALEQMRRVAGPPAKAMNTLLKWIESAVGVDHKCTAHWDHIACEGIAVRHVAALFNCTMVFVRSKRSVARQHWVAADIIDEADLLARLPVAVRDVSPDGNFVIRGVLPFDPSARPRHHSKRKSERSRSLVALSDDESPNIHNWPLDPTTSAPVILDVFTQYQNVLDIVIALKCKGPGSSNPPALQVTPGSASWCSSGSSTPTSVTFSLIVNPFSGPAGSASTTSPIAIDTTMCRAANSTEWAFRMIPSASDIGFNVVCAFKVDSLPPMTLWQRYTMLATVQFGDGSSSPAARFQNYFQGRFFTDPQSYSTDGGVINFIGYQGATPARICELYGVPPQTPRAQRTGAAATIAQGVVEFTDVTEPGHGFFTEDLVTFMTNLSISDFLVSDLVTINGQANVFQGETSLDIELIMGVSPGVRTYLYNAEYGTGTTCAEYDCSFLTLLSDIAAGTGALGQQPASVWSISYGGPEEGMPIEYLESRFRALSGSGVTIVASSGDDGAGWDSEVTLVAEFPSSAPSVVGAGATAIVLDPVNGGTDGVSEIVCSDADLNVITSGGGFSPNFVSSSFQEAFVNSYIAPRRAALEARGAPSDVVDQLYPSSPAMQGTPDIAALGANIITVINQRIELLYGTSASAPILASIITRINIERLSRGQSTMRYFTEFAYGAKLNGTGAFVDVVSGSNCAAEYSGPLNGLLMSYNDTQCYAAGPGWDPVSGLGTVNYPALLAAALQWNPPAPPVTPSPTKSQSGSSSPSTSTAVVVGCAVGAAVVASALVLIVLRYRRASAQHSGSSHEAQYALYGN